MRNLSTVASESNGFMAENNIVKNFGAKEKMQNFKKKIFKKNAFVKKIAIFQRIFEA